MTLKSKIDNAIWTSSSSEVVDNLEQIADEFAIGFAVFLDKNKKEYKGLFLEEILEIYKETL